MKKLSKFMKLLLVLIIGAVLLHAVGFSFTFNFNDVLYNNIVSLLNSIPFVVQLFLALLMVYYFVRITKELRNVLKSNTWFAKIKNWVKPRMYNCAHSVIICLLSIYVLFNWEKCIDMKFFDDFDGNNILFLCWIVLIFLTTYDVESKVLKIHMRKTAEQMKDVDEVTLSYDLALRERDLQNSMSEKDKGGESNE